MVAEEVVVILSGGGPWGFRLQGGAEYQMPLQVAKVRGRRIGEATWITQTSCLIANLTCFKNKINFLVTLFSFRAQEKIF